MRNSVVPETQHGNQSTWSGQIRILLAKIDMKQFDLDPNPPDEDLILKRQKRLENIFLGHCKDKINAWSVAGGFMGIFLCIIFNFVNLCLPWHDPIKNSGYWHENAIINCSSMAILTPLH